MNTMSLLFVIMLCTWVCILVTSGLFEYLWFIDCRALSESDIMRALKLVLSSISCSAYEIAWSSALQMLLDCNKTNLCV